MFFQFSAGCVFQPAASELVERERESSAGETIQQYLLIIERSVFLVFSEWRTASYSLSSHLIFGLKISREMRRFAQSAAGDALMDDDMESPDQIDDNTQFPMTNNFSEFLPTLSDSSAEIAVDVVDTPAMLPRYLNETFSSSADDCSVQAEGERLLNTFRSGSHWTLKKLPNSLTPGSIRTERKEHTMTNLLGEEKSLSSTYEELEISSPRNDPKVDIMQLIR